MTESSFKRMMSVRDSLRPTTQGEKMSESNRGRAALTADPRPTSEVSRVDTTQNTQATASSAITLRRAMHSREGQDEAERQIKCGRKAYAILRTGRYYPRPQTAIVFGTCRSDAIRRAAAPARLGEEIHGDVTEARRIDAGWDDPIIWPFERATA